VATLTRLIAWAAIGVVVVGLVMALRQWRTFESSDAVCEAERAWPDIGQRLRTSHDYQTTPDQVSAANPDLVCALEAETQQRVTSRVIEPLGRPWPIFVLLGLCGSIAIAWFSALVAWPDWRVATARLMLVPVHYSDVQMEPLPEHVALGDDLVVRLHVEGRPLQRARVLYRSTGEAEWKEVGLQSAIADALINDLNAVVPDCRRDLEIQIEAGPLTSGVHSVGVRLPLVLEEWNAIVKPPAYTGLPAVDGAPEGLRIPQGSNLQLAAKYNREPREVEVGITPPSAPSSETEIANTVAHLSIKTGAETMDLSIQATASDGMEDASSLHIDVVPDRRPELKFVAPEKNTEAIPTAELRFTLEAFDDYGLGSVGIRYRVDDGPEQTLWEHSPSDSSAAMAQTITLPLEDLDVRYPQALTYYAYAIDNQEPEAQRATSELRFVDIRPFSREYEFKEGQCSGNCQGECLTLEKLIKQQREILGRTFAIVHRDQADDNVAAKLAREEKELRAKTESLTTALEEKLGPMPSLALAIESMSAAIDDLLVNAIADGQADEERALAGLIAARKNLRKILKQNDSQSQMCRNVDQQQIDKIRKPERDREQNQEQQLAQLRQQLDQLAKQQESFCQSAKTCQQPGQSSSSSKSASDPKASDDKKTDNSPSASEQPTREQLVHQQQQAATKAREIQRNLSAGMFGELAPKRAEQAAKTIELSGESLAKTDADPLAIARAEQAAEQLKRLSEHLGRRHNPDFSDKLAAVGRQAQRLSDQQQQLSQSLSQEIQDATEPNGRDQNADEVAAQEQRRLTSRTEELVDLVDQLQAESTDEDWQVQRALTEQVSANSPRQAAAGMRQAVEALEQDRRQSASENGLRAGGILERFAAGIKQVQQAMGPARLDQLTKAEQRAAALLKDLQRADSPAERAMVQAGTRQFAESIRPLARGDAELTDATEMLNNSGSTSSNSSDTRREATASPKLASSPTYLVEGLRLVDEVLQRRIQEAILSGSMQQPVGAVPPQYSQMVDEYYRALSEDVE
jgi:hypothetical protein